MTGMAMLQAYLVRKAIYKTHVIIQCAAVAPFTYHGFEIIANKIYAVFEGIRYSFIKLPLKRRGSRYFYMKSELFTSRVCRGDYSRAHGDWRIEVIWRFGELYRIWTRLLFFHGMLPLEKSDFEDALDTRRCTLHKRVARDTRLILLCQQLHNGHVECLHNLCYILQ